MSRPYSYFCLISGIAILRNDLYVLFSLYKTVSLKNSVVNGIGSEIIRPDVVVTKIVSGTVGAEDSPHGWVEIVQGGERYTYDVELEMAMHRDGYPNTNLYEMPNTKRRSWNYVGADYSDDKFHRETTVAILPG